MTSRLSLSSVDCAESRLCRHCSRYVLASQIDIPPLSQLHNLGLVRQVGWLRRCGGIPLTIPVRMPHLHPITFYFHETQRSDATMPSHGFSDRPPRHSFIHLYHDSIPHTLPLRVSTKTHRPSLRKVDPSHVVVHRERRTRAIDATVSDPHPIVSRNQSRTCFIL